MNIEAAARRWATDIDSEWDDLDEYEQTRITRIMSTYIAAAVDGKVLYEKLPDGMGVDAYVQVWPTTNSDSTDTGLVDGDKRD